MRFSAALIFPETCSILGDLVKKVGWMMAKFPRNLWDFGECWTNFLGNSMILLDQRKIFLVICSIFGDLVKLVGWMMVPFLNSLYIRGRDMLSGALRLKVRNSTRSKPPHDHVNASQNGLILAFRPTARGCA